MALARVSSCRRAAAAVSGAVPGQDASAAASCSVLAAGFERGDDLAEVGGDLLVHLGDAGVAGGLGGGDELQGGLLLGVVLGQELGVVTNIGQVRHELACGQVFTTGSWQ